MKKQIHLGGESLVLTGDDKEKLESLQAFLDELMTKTGKETKTADTKKNLSYALISLVIELWDELKQKYRFADNTPTVLEKIELLNDKIIEKLKDDDESMDQR